MGKEKKDKKAMDELVKRIDMLQDELRILRNEVALLKLKTAGEPCPPCPEPYNTYPTNPWEPKVWYTSSTGGPNNG